MPRRAMRERCRWPGRLPNDCWRWRSAIRPASPGIRSRTMKIGWVAWRTERPVSVGPYANGTDRIRGKNGVRLFMRRMPSSNPCSIPRWGPGRMFGGGQARPRASGVTERPVSVWRLTGCGIFWATMPATMLYGLRRRSLGVSASSTVIACATAISAMPNCSGCWAIMTERAGWLGPWPMIFARGGYGDADCPPTRPHRD